MKDFNINVPRKKGIAAMAGIAIVTLSGYLLYFSASSTLSSKNKEIDLYKEKAAHAEESVNSIKKQMDNKEVEFKQVSKELESLQLNQQECKMKLEEQQSKVGELIQVLERYKKELDGAKPAAAPVPGNSAAPAPADSAAPGATPPASDKPDEKPISSATSNMQVAGLNCPSSQDVTSHVKEGQWEGKDVKWWVDFASRPLNDNESVKDLYKMLYDGQSIACYYALENGQDAVWMVVKGINQNKKPVVLSAEGWTPCPTDECRSICEKDNLSKCHFTIQGS